MQKAFGARWRIALGSFSWSVMARFFSGVVHDVACWQLVPAVIHWPFLPVVAGAVAVIRATLVISLGQRKIPLQFGTSSIDLVN